MILSLLIKVISCLILYFVADTQAEDVSLKPKLVLSPVKNKVK